MKPISMVLASAAALAIATPALAQAAGKPAAAPAAPHYTTQDTTIGTLIAHPAAKAVVDKYLPGLTDSPQIGMAAGMTLRAIQPMAGDQVPVEKLDAIDADLAKLPPKK